MIKISSFIKAAKSLGASALFSILRGVLEGFAMSLVLTLILFYWGETVLGLKYIIGCVFFLASGVMLSLWRVLKGLLTLVDKKVDNAVDGLSDKASELMGDKVEMLNPETQFIKVRNLVSDKCPAISPLLSAVDYNQIIALASKSSRVSKASSFVSSKVETISRAPQTLKKMVETLKLVYQAPVLAVIRKAVLSITIVSIVVLVVRLLML
ncbi:MAG: hypothetical protein MJZ31_10090 [Bacteroidales bacterium]|nr:hypothetical protein [Bacteroidales bacterium]